MDVLRQEVVDTEHFEISDIITFTLTTGETVEAIAVAENSFGMIFITVDCLCREYKMFDDPRKAWYLDYEHSDLRKTLNTNVLDTFPSDIRSKMVRTYKHDFIRIPTEKEMFGRNFGKEEESKHVYQFYGMEKRRNRIALEGNLETSLPQCYWLQNEEKEELYCFSAVSPDGRKITSFSHTPKGVRLVFTLENYYDV